ncbi:MAG: 4-hydroxybenzoate octaprenyltransferase [Hyphomicrobiaceae bacterium]|nr:4-hydroxybenzoate octaprenyltransferase [Hyphomicrobiaceae bacterium]
MQSGSTPDNGRVADAQRGNWVDHLAPVWARPYLRLSRLDRPIGFWLLLWPCAFSVGLIANAQPANGFNFGLLLWFLVGSIAMRGAGCTFNDLVDVDIDAKVERTRSRPIPSGQVSKRNAAIWLVVQALVGLVVLLQLSPFAIWLGVASLVLVAIYPFMKRITWWPQLFLGLAFSYGALMGWADKFGALHFPAYILYLGTILWVIGYDTIYALQDKEDDALVGVKSTALLFGERARLMTALFYAGAFALWLWAGWAAQARWLYVVVAIPAGALLVWQVLTLDMSSPANCLKRFKANHWVGLALTLALYLDSRF